MPASDQELVTIVDNLVTGFVAPDQLEDLRWKDGSSPSPSELHTMLGMFGYIMSQMRKPPGQRKAMRLLRSLLSLGQRRMLRSHRYFYVTGKSGATFRFHPRAGHSERVKRHGSRWFTVSSFCLHDEAGADKMPPADIVVAHMLLIAADEDRFLRLANEHENNSQLWNGEYLRRMRARRLA